ncbi:hypothetical protein Taro_043206 [Colocasia esculenta]|uniref:Methyltransferase type 11 domain-containing protein n=1 Tax=Colocasia esculenta TaxID=4460 RepID=A0A843WYF5_COLES|nr:hypothetical protein [Colocasia esculenta]
MEDPAVFGSQIFNPNSYSSGFIITRTQAGAWATMGAALQTGRSAGEAEAAGLNKRIAEYYDRAAEEWESEQGDHWHIGFYDPGEVSTVADQRAARARTVEEALRFAGISDDPERRPKNILDVGCGIGGSSRYLVKRYGAKCTAFTISPKEVERAKALTAAEGLADKVSYLVADAHQQPFPDGEFDLVWSMSSAELMVDKRKFVSEMARVAAPGGTIVIVTWCHRDLLPSEASLRPEDLDLLKRIGNIHCAPVWCSAADFVKIAESLLLEDIESADWSENVAPLWAAITRTRYTWQGLTSVARRGWTGIKHAYATALMIEAHNKGLLKCCIITCQKPRTTSQ